MSAESFHQMLDAFATGLGLCLLGAANAFLRRSSVALRATLSVSIIGLMTGLVFELGEAGGARSVALVLSAVYSCLLLAGSMWLANAISAIGAAVRSPVVRWSALGVVGFGTAIGSVAYTDVQFQKEVDRQTTELEVLTLPPHCETPAIHAVSDCGREVAIREATELRGEADLLKMETTIFTHNSVHDSVIRCQPASDRSNCHGWVFTGGRFWIAGTEVDNILVENGYRVEREPKPGDLVLYRSDGNLLHTAIVRYVTEGQPVLVEGKWGCTGVYLHAVDKSIYGTGYQFYRSPRLGHVLAGLQAAEVNPTHGSPHIVYDHTNPDEFTD